ncbi:MAG: type II secretion system protein [Sarcina sp.]
MRKVKKGMTILEIVIGLAIIGIMLLPLANGLLTSVRANKKAEDTQAGKLLGQQVVEKLKVEERIENDIKIPFHNDELMIGTGISDVMGKKTFPITSSTEINGFNIDGKIIEEEGVIAINDIAYNTSADMNKEIGLYIEIDKMFHGDREKIVLRWIERGVNLKKIEDFVVYDGVLEKKVIFNNQTMDLKIKIDNTGKVELKTGEKITKQGREGEAIVDSINEVINKLEGAIVIYAKNVSGANKVTIEVENKNEAKFEEVQILRDVSVKEKDWEEGLRVECKEKVLKFDNIIYDIYNKKRGLYTIDLDVMKNEKVVEKTKAQFYLEE